MERVCVKVAGGDVGASEVWQLNLLEIDDHGALSAVVRWGVDDLDAAYAELDALIRTIRATPGAWARHDWNAYRKILAPDCRLRDHRVLGWGTILDDPETIVRAQETLVELAPDSRYRMDHVRISGRVVLQIAAHVGTRDGGAFETPVVTVAVYNAETRLQEVDIYDFEQISEAQARFEERCADRAL